MHFHLTFFAFALSAVSAMPLPRRSIFDKTTTVSSTKHINASVDDTIAALHNFPLMINLNPLVTSSVADPNNSNVFSVTDTLSLFLGLTTDTTYQATFETVADGMNTNSAAAAGVTLNNQWRAVANPSGGTDLTETDTITSNFLLSSFITSELSTSHDQLMDTLAAKLEGTAA